MTALIQDVPATIHPGRHLCIFNLPHRPDTLLQTCSTLGMPSNLRNSWTPFLAFHTRSALPYPVLTCGIYSIYV